MLEENQGLMKRLIQPTGAGYTGMIMVANWRRMLRPLRAMLRALRASVPHAFGHAEPRFEALIIKQVIRVYS